MDGPKPTLVQLAANGRFEPTFTDAAIVAYACFADFGLTSGGEIYRSKVES